MVNFVEKQVDLSFSMNLRHWKPAGTEKGAFQFLVIHGLGSNAKTWDKVGRILSQRGHEVIAIDQRNHGLSEPRESGFDFETITADLFELLELLEWEAPILAGQSWGGNVVLEFGARYPDRAKGYVMVDGGFIDLKLYGDTWEEIYERLLPPDVSKFTAEMMHSMIQVGHPDWDEEGIEATLANLKILENGHLERRLPVDRHMRIVRHMFEQNMGQLFQSFHAPALICAAGRQAEPDEQKRNVLENAKQIEQLTLHWFANTDHDIHIHKPDELCQVIFNWLNTID